MITTMRCPHTRGAMSDRRNVARDDAACARAVRGAACRHAMYIARVRRAEEARDIDYY